jgi:hypothetical protein
MKAKFKWLNTNLCFPPHRVTHIEKYELLKQKLQDSGWDINCPVLLGYHFSNKIQLISGSHRWAVMNELNQKIPVLIYSYNDIESIYGTDTWIDFVKKPPLLKEVINE